MIQIDSYFLESFVHLITQWQVQDFPDGRGEGRQSLTLGREAIIYEDFSENCIKMKEFRARGVGRSWRPLLDPPMLRDTTLIKTVLN